MATRMIPLQIYQSTMSKALEKISQTDDIQEVFRDVLCDVRNYYKAGRVAIMATVPGHPDLQLSVFEMNADGMPSTTDRMTSRFKKHRWRYDKLERGESVVVNVSTGKVYGTRQWYRNFNITVTENQQNYSETLRRLHPDDRQKVLDYRKRALKDPEPKFRERLRVCKNDGDEGWNYVKVYSVVTHFDPQHGDVETSTISHSINRKVAMEQSLIRAKNDAEKADRLKSAFLANMSHEIRTPLNAIVGFSQLLCHDEIPGDDRKNVMNIIETNNALLLQLINDILDLAKLETGTQEFVVKDTDVNEICQATLNAITMRVKKGVSLVLDCPLHFCHIQTDPNRLKQVLLNFASNAAKFTSKGHIKIGYRLVDDERIRLFAEDTGIGIDNSKTAHVFDRFVKLNDFEQGTGLGLQISKEIITHFGGDIGVDSTPGIGSIFWCEIPIDCNTSVSSNA